MLRGIIRGHIVSTKKQSALIGSKFMEVEIMKNGALTGDFIVAVDTVGAGINEEVLITTGSSARLAMHNANAPCDAVIVGIVD